MNAEKKIKRLQKELSAELHNEILPFWMDKAVDEQSNGYHGRILQDGSVDHKADRTMILNARILWTFSAAFRRYGGQEYQTAARRAYAYIMNHFYDYENGGYYWSVDSTGQPVQTRKHLYALSFTVYGLSEYYRATEQQEVLDAAIALFEKIEEVFFEPESSGYHEAADMYWNKVKDSRLSDDEPFTKFTFNTHLHLMEAYSNLYKAWPNQKLKIQIQYLIRIHLDHIYNKEDGHFYSFFEKNWKVTEPKIYSYGHDIEAVWLLYDAANAIEDQALKEELTDITVKTAELTLQEGINSETKGLYSFGADGKVVNKNKQWWAQAEGIVGFMYAWSLQQSDDFIESAEGLWEFIKNHVKDTEYGEWFGEFDADGNPKNGEDKVGPWKCPYHNARACMEAEEFLVTVNSIRENQK